MTKSDARIEGIVARVANVAVIFRRGPTRETQMLLWDLNTDEVTPGQWIRARVNVRECDVTPDGRLLVAGIYDAASRREPRGGAYFGTPGWTAISRPPYFTALALWFDLNGLGGLWSSARDLHIFGDLATKPPDKGHLDRRIRRHEFGRSGQSYPRIFEARLRRDGWTQFEAARYIRVDSDWRSDKALVRQLKAAGADLAPLEAMRPGEFPHWVQIGSARWEREFPGGRLVRSGTGESEETILVQDEAGEVRWERTVPWNSWAWIDLDGRDRLIFSDRGCLWTWADFPEGKPKLVADLNENVFTPVEPFDWTLEWPSDSPPEW